MPLGYTLEHKTKAQQAYETLRQAIYAGEFPPGTPLVISSLATSLNVSEIPIREALQRLKHEELVTIVPYTGTVVSPIILDRVRQSLETRAILEGYANKLATPHLTDEDLNLLAELIGDMDQCIASGDMRRYSQTNRQFHLVILERCPNVRTREILDAMFLESERARAIFMVKPTHANVSNEEHKALLTLLRVKDGEAAEAIMRSHQLRVAREFAALQQELQHLGEM
jgi:DNA-binding GntR family transcriptional regulator